MPQWIDFLRPFEKKHIAILKFLSVLLSQEK